MKKIVCISVAAAFLLGISGCASRPSNIGAAYVSPLEYGHYSCDQIRQEAGRVKRKVMEVTGQQKKEADKDALAFGVGMIVFWPALFFMIGEDKEEELARLKGEYEALEKAAIEKECPFVEEFSRERQAEKEQNEKKKSRQADSPYQGR